MIRTVDSEQQRTVAMLQRWVDQNSGTMNKAGVEAVRDMVAPELQQLGFKIQWKPHSTLSVARACWWRMELAPTVSRMI